MRIRFVRRFRNDFHERRAVFRNICTQWSASAECVHYKLLLQMDTFVRHAASLLFFAERSCTISLHVRCYINFAAEEASVPDFPKCVCVRLLWRRFLRGFCLRFLLIAVFTVSLNYDV